MARTDDQLIRETRARALELALKVNDVAHPYFAVSSIPAVFEVAAAFEFFIIHGTPKPQPRAQESAA